MKKFEYEKEKCCENINKATVVSVPNSDSSDEKLHLSIVIPSFRRRYFFDGIFWYKKDDGKGIEMLNNEQIKVMKKNTVEGQWLLDGKFEERTDIRTWITEENWV